jgi:hypothetical protein
MTGEIDTQFLSELARGGFAERMTKEQRRGIHVKTNLDGFIDDSLEQGKQVVLTGNPGDGKTQYIYMKKDRYQPPDYFYLMDASEYADYGSLLEEWETAYRSEKPGILAINDGPLFEMTTEYSDEYEFLRDVRQQFQNQIVYDDSEAEHVDFSDIVVVDLNNRNVLTRKVVLQVIRKLTDEQFLEDHDHTGTCHIQYNIQKLRDKTVRDNMKSLLGAVGKINEHVTIRDLINFIAYCITAGESECLTGSDFDDSLRYHNLAFSGDGKIFELLNQHFNPRELTHPFIDSELWSRAEEEVSPRDSEELRESIDREFLKMKRRFYFEDDSMGIDYNSHNMYHDIDYSFYNNRNRPNENEAAKEDTIRKINGYFMPSSSERRYLNVWMSHRYRSRASRSLISRTQVPKSELDRKTPRLHPEIQDALSYVGDHYILEYDSKDSVRLKITQELSKALSALDANAPYRIRDQETERQLLQFMEEIEYLEEHTASAGEICIKDTETGEVETVEIDGERYRVG